MMQAKKNRELRRLLYLVMVIFLMVSCDQRTGQILRGVSHLLDSVEMAHASDTRISYWNVYLQGDDGVYSVQGEVVSKAAYENLDRQLGQQFPEVKNEVLLLTDDGSGVKVNGLINNSVANFRAAPGSRNEMVTQALLGTPVRILKVEDGWGLVQTPNGYMGWVNDSEFYAMDQKEIADFREARKVIYSEQYGSSYTRPDENSMPVSDLVLGCMLSVISSEAGFIQVQYPDGRMAWIRGEELIEAEEVFNRSLSPEGLVESVLEFNGIPYLWGGSSSKAIDCSGLTSNVFFMNGTLLPRDADQQALCGREISTEYDFENLMPGDLLFFGRKASEEQPESVSHVVIYLDDSEFIHAAGFRDRVSINSMDSTRENFIPDYPEIFVRSVRILGEELNGFEPIKQNIFYKEIINTTE